MWNDGLLMHVLSSYVFMMSNLAFFRINAVGVWAIHFLVPKEQLILCFSCKELQRYIFCGMDWQSLGQMRDSGAL